MFWETFGLDKYKFDKLQIEPIEIAQLLCNDFNSCYYCPLNLIDHKLRNHQAITKTNFLAQFSPNNFYFSFTGPKKNIGIIRLKDTQPPFCDYIIHGCSLGVY